MRCIKTGFDALLYSRHIHGDAFVLSPASRLIERTALDYDEKPHPLEYRTADWLLLRVCSVDVSYPLDLKVQLHIDNPDRWFDERVFTRKPESSCRIYYPNSTILVEPGEWRWLGYGGEQVKL